MGSLKFQFDEKYQKNEEGPLETMKKIAKKVSQSRNNMHKKILVKCETRTHVLLLRRPQKSRLTSVPNGQNLVWQLTQVEATSYKICHLSGPTKRKQVPVEVVWHLVLVQVSL